MYKGLCTGGIGHFCKFCYEDVKDNVVKHVKNDSFVGATGADVADHTALYREVKGHTYMIPDATHGQSTRAGMRKQQVCFLWLAVS